MDWEVVHGKPIEAQVLPLATFSEKDDQDKILPLAHRPDPRFYDDNKGPYDNKDLQPNVPLGSVPGGNVGYKGSGNTGYPGQKVYDEIMSSIRLLFLTNVWNEVEPSEAPVQDEKQEEWDDYALKLEGEETKYNRLRIFRAKPGEHEGQSVPFCEGLWYRGPSEAYVYMLKDDTKAEGGEAAQGGGAKGKTADKEELDKQRQVL